MAKVDRSTRDINQRVKRAVGGTSKRAQNAGKMFLHVGGEFLKANFPTPFAFVETNKDVLESTTKFLRNPVDSVNRQINRALATDDFKALRKLAKNTLDDLKSGNYYDPDRYRSADMEMLNDAMSELDNFDFDFGGFDLSEFDENGDWVDTSNDSAKADINTQLKVAALQDAKDDARTTATVNAIVTGTQAQIQNDNSNSQVNIRMMLKQHSEVMQSQENLIQGQQATFELISKSSEAHANLFREAHNQVMEKFDTTIDLLKKIEANTQKPVVTEKKKKETIDIFGSKGELDLKAYGKMVKKNIAEKFSGIGISGGGIMGIPLQQIIESYGDNPVASILEIALNAAIPKKTRNQMERTSQNMEKFLPALLQKMTDRGRRYETGKSDSKFDMLMGLLAPSQESTARISTRKDDYLKAAQLTGKTVRAIEEVIPMWLARIDSHITGGPLMVYDYADGKLKNAGKVISDNERYNRNMTSSMDGYYEAVSRARGYKFKNEDEQKKFLNFVHNYFQNAAEEDKFINPWGSKKDFMTGMEVPEGSNYYEMLAAILRNMNPENSKIKGSNKAAIVNLVSSIRNARSGRNDRNFRTNKELQESGNIAAWSFMDNDIRKEIINNSMGYEELTEEDIENISQSRRKAVMKQGGLNANNVLLADILKTLRAGIITYSMKPSTVDNLPDYVKEKLRVRNTPNPRGSYSSTAQNLNDPITAEVDELYANTMSMEQLMEQQGAIYYNKTEDERQREIDRLRKEGKDPVNRYNTTIRDKAKYYEKAFNESNFGKLVATTREIANKPFQLFNSAMQMIDDMIYKTLLGTDALPEGQKDGPIDRNESPSILKMTMNIIAGQFNRVSGFINNSLKRVDDYLFAPEHGLIPRAIKSIGEMLGFDELKEKAKNKVKGIREKAVKKFVGTKGEDGTYSGGMFSGVANAAKTEKGNLETEIKSSINRLLYGDYAASKGKFEGFIVDENGNATQKKDYGGVVGKLRKGFDNLNTILFGEDPNSDSRRKWNKVKGAFKEAAPNIVGGAGIGAITGLFLPGGPILGAILGSVGGLVKGSSALNKYLFGEYSDEMEDVIDLETGEVATDWRGRKKTRKKQTKEGIFSRELQEGVKKMVPAGILGGIGGKIAGSGIVSLSNKLGILPATTSLLPFTIMGVGLGFMSTSDNFKKMIFGDVDDPKSGLISKDFRTKAIDTIKKVAPHAAGGAIIGSKMAGVMGKLGILPGFMLGPGGTIMTILGGITMGSQADKINKFLFGEESEVEEDIKDKDGNVTGKRKKKVRQGGIFGQAYDYMKNKVLEPIAKGMNKVVKGIGNWFKEDVLGPLGRSIEPLKEKLGEAGKSIKESLSNIGNNIATGITRALGIVPEDQDMKTFWEKNVKGKLKQTFNKLFSGLGKLIGNILSAPFKALEAIVRGSTQPSEDDDGLGDGTGTPKKRKGLIDRWRDGMRDRRHKRQAARLQRAGAALGGAFKTAGGHINNIGMGFADFSDNVSTHIAQSINGLGDAAGKVFNGKKGVNTSNKAAATSWTMAELQAMPVDDAIANLQKKQSQGIPLTPAESSFMITFGRRRSNVATTQNRNINTDLKNATSREAETDIDDSDSNDKTSRRQARADAKEERRNRKKSANFAKDNHKNLKKIAKNTGKIYEEIRGQLGGVGWNVAYIKTLLEKQYGPLSNDQLPEEMEGSTKNVRKKRGFFGKIKDKAGDIFESFAEKFSSLFGGKDKKSKKGGKGGKGGRGGGFAKFFKVISAPFRLIGGIGGFVSDMLLNIFDVIGATLKMGITAIGETLKIGCELIKGAAKGIGSALGDAAALFVGTVKDIALSVTSVLRGTLQFLMDTVPTLASEVIKAGVGLLKGGVKGVIGLGKAAASGIKGIGTKIKARRDKKKGITTKTKIESIGTFQIAGGHLDTVGETYPMIGDKLTPQPIPIVSISKGKAVSTIPYAIPVYVANDSIPAIVKKMATGDTDNLNRDYTNTYKEVDRRAESSANPNEVYDKAIASAKTKEERDAILHAAQLNAAKQQLLGSGSGNGSGNGEEDNQGTLSSILSMFGVNSDGGSILGTIGKTITAAFAGSKIGKFILNTVAPMAGAGLSLGVAGLPGIIGTYSSIADGIQDHDVGEIARGTRFGARTFVKTGTNALTLGKSAKYAATAKGTAFRKIGNDIAKATGNAVTKLANWVKKAVNKLFGEGAIKNEIKRLGNSSSVKEKILSGINSNIDKFIASAGKASAEQLLKKCNLVLMIAGAVVDFTKGYRSADQYFDVDHSDLTFGMKLTAGLCNAISGLAFGLIPEDWLTQFLYGILASEEDKQNLAENQQKLKTKVDTFNAENNTNYTVEEWQKKYDENGERRNPGLFKGIWNKLSGKDWYGDELSDEEKAENQQNMQRNLDNFHALGAGRYGRGVTHYNQRDSRWNHGTNMATVGCGPTAAAMVGSAYGDNRNPLVANAMSYGMGMRAADGGMNPAFFSQYANSNYGMAQGPNSGSMVASNLAKGQPVIMMGKGGAFGSGMHYMVADKMVGKGKVNMIDPYTGGNKIGNLGSVMKNTSATVYSFGKGRGFGGGGTGSSQSFANVTSSTNGSSGRGNGFGGNVRGAQQALCNKMAAVEGKIKYTTSGAQDPDQGTASCASMCGWAYKKVFPDVFSSSPMSANAYYSSQDSRFRTIYVNDGSQTFDLSMLQPGDLLYFDWRTERIMDGKMSHVDMYAGNNQVWYHGGDPIMGPVKKEMTNYRITHLMKVRRYTPFITGDVKTYDDSDVNYSGSATSSSEDTDYSSDNTFLGQITGLLENAGNKLSNFFSFNNSSDDDSSSSSSSSSGSTSGSASAVVTSSTNLGMSSSTKENGKKIWKFFKDKGLTTNQIAGIMGNLYQESLLRPENVSDYFNSRTGITDQGYTDSVDNGTYSTFATDGEGYGLPMWTVSDNKGPLLESAKKSNKSVGDLGLQLDFLWNDLSTKYKDSLLDPIRQSDSLEDVAVKFMQVYEKPAGYKTDAKKNERINAAKTVLSQFGTGRGDTTNLNAMNDRIRGMNGTMTKLAEFGRGESTAVMATKQIADAITSTDFGKGNGDGTTQQMLQLMTKTFGQIVSLLSDIKDNTSNQSSSSSSSTSSSVKTARADNYNANGSANSLNTTDYGKIIVDNLTKR